MTTALLTGFIDLHSHTSESDGSLRPEELVQKARDLGLDALAITDHDTLKGYEAAIPHARTLGLDLVCGIELNTRYVVLGNPERVRSLHLLGYFPTGTPSATFQEQLARLQGERQERNCQLTTKLQGLGIAITLAEVESRGKSVTGRPHFAKVLVEKGYARDSEDAFRRFIGETAPGFVELQSGTVQEGIEMVLAGGGVPVAAHPIRLNIPRDQERRAFAELKEFGLAGLEVIHSEQDAALQAHYSQIAQELGLLPTGGSDFHGAIKPSVELGSGIRGNVRVPRRFLDGLRELAS